MGKYWLMDRHGADGPSALVETNGSMQVIDVLRFGPAVTELEDQQKLWDEVIGAVAPSMKPIVPAAKLTEAGTPAHADLARGEDGGIGRSGRRKSARGSGSSGRTGGGAKRTGGRGRG